MKYLVHGIVDDKYASQLEDELVASLCCRDHGRGELYRDHHADFDLFRRAFYDVRLAVNDVLRYRRRDKSDMHTHLCQTVKSRRIRCCPGLTGCENL